MEGVKILLAVTISLCFITSHPKPAPGSCREAKKRLQGCRVMSPVAHTVNDIILELQSPPLTNQRMQKKTATMHECKYIILY